VRRRSADKIWLTLSLFTLGIYDQVAKESKDSTASDHEIHDVETGATSGGAQGKATAEDHKGTPVCFTSLSKHVPSSPIGLEADWTRNLQARPRADTSITIQGLVKTDDLPEKAGKDELRARAAELNK